MNGFVGVDGCKAGWFAVQIWDRSTWQLSTHGTIADLWRSCSGAHLILIDIPIGLVDWGRESRRCDGEARRLLGWPRSSSVFTPPARPALAEPTREAALACNQEISGRKLTIQAWSISPKIREVDQLLRSDLAARERMRETHPELLFWALNDGKAMRNSKKRGAGYGERLAVLRALFPRSNEVAAQALARFPRHRVARDDILDALVAAVGGLFSGGALTSIPVPPERDTWGLPMEIVYWEAHPAARSNPEQL